MEKRYQVFVSSTYKDLIPHRQLVMKSLMQVNAIPAGMEMFPASDDESWNIIKRSIDESDYYLVIIGGRYGSVDASGVSFTEREYDYAVSKGIPAMAFLHGKPESLSRDKTETQEGMWEKLKCFRSKAQQKHCKFWEDDAELVTAVLTSYHHLIHTRPAIGWVRGDQAKTVDELEKVIRLQETVRELEARLSSTSLSERAERMISGNDHVLVQIGLRGSESAGRQSRVGWRQLFVEMGSHIADVNTEATLMRRFSEFVLQNVDLPDRPPIKTKEFDAWAMQNFVGQSDWTKYRRSLSLEGLIDVDGAESEYSSGFMRQRSMVRLIRLTELGKLVLSKCVATEASTPPDEAD